LSAIHKKVHGSGDEPIFESFGHTREAIRNYLEKCPPSLSALLVSLTELHMKKLQKKRWIEKTPLHLLYVNKIREAFPHSPIIRIVRDPRDASLSMMKTPWGPSTFYDALLDWKKYDDRSARYFENDPLAYTVHYEKLLEDPEKELRGVCEFIGESYEPAMLDASRSFDPMKLETRPWLSKVKEPVDPSRIRVWERELSADQNRLAESLVGNRLEAYGYPCKKLFGRTAKVVPRLEALRSFPALADSLARQGVKFWESNPAKHRGPLIYAGIPGLNKWNVGTSRRSKFIYILRSIKDIVGTMLSLERVHWACPELQKRSNNSSERLLCWILSPFKSSSR
jgi:hypothetical protein